MSTAKPFVAVLLGLRWVLAPFVLIALILYCGRADFAATEVAPPAAAPTLWPAVERMELEIAILQDSGNPARDAILVVSEPELERAVVDEGGIARLDITRAEHIVFLAYAPGFALYQGERDVAADGTVAAVQLQPIRRPDFSGGDPLVKLTRTVRLSDGQDAPLASLLVLARETGDPDSEPWVAISDARGVATFPDATAADLHLDIYPAGMPPRLATRLGAIDVPADQQETPLRLTTARLELSGLTPDTLFEWKRLDQAQLLPLHRVTESGVLQLGPVPPGLYRLGIDGRDFDRQLSQGLTRLNALELSAAAE
jgi:hypothetical protein